MTLLWMTLALTLLLLGLAMLGAVSVAYVRCGDAYDAKLRHKLAVQHEQFLAEQRLQHLTQDALQAMLDASRQSGHPTSPRCGEWYQP